MQIHIGEDGRNNPALRRTRCRVQHLPAGIQYPCFQPPPDEFQQWLVINAQHQHIQQFGVVDVVEETFKDGHRTEKKYFTRPGKLDFSIMIILILRKTVKSIQLMLNEITPDLGVISVSNSAFTQRRAQLKHTAFIELNEKAIVEVMYRDDDFERYKGMRILGVDGSKILLPDTQSVIREFGQIGYSNDHPDVKGEHAYAMASVMYDVLNCVAVDSKLAPAKAYEVDLAVGHLAHTRKNDLLITDRNYPSYRWLASVKQAKRHFLSRCSASSFAVARKMLKGEGPDSQIVTLRPSHEKLNNHPLKAGGLECLAAESLDTGRIALLIWRFSTFGFEIVVGISLKVMFQIVANHLFCHLPYRSAKIASCPKVLAPVTFFQRRKFFEQFPCTTALYPSHDFTWSYVWRC